MRDSDALSDQWLLVSKLLDEALLLPVTEHAQWLIDLPRSHAHLRETLRSFLELHAQVDGDQFLEAGVNLGSAALTPATDVNAGDLIGPYRLIEELGTGGMGAVWLAERADGALRRRVALKLPRLVWASNLAERMSTERDILAALEHANIARLYDAGVDERGRPFLALEYVEGQRITDYCDQRCLDVRARAQLFLQVLDAVQYAHAQLVLHRDIKPANVLVNERGEVRLLDFGIAKIIDEPTVGSDEQGSTIGHPLTPKYASPEQLANQRLTLVSDVYSLGVMLYQLLVGRLPYRTRDDSRIALEIAVMDGEITPPDAAELNEKTAEQRSTSVSRLKRQLTADVGAVILKALQRNPAARYSSVEALRADLTRWLDNLPVQAKPPSVLDRISKFVTRNRWPVAVTVTAFIAISIAAAIAVIQANEAKAESLRAQATRDFLISLFDNANPESRQDNDITVGELLSIGERNIDQYFSEQSETKGMLLGALSQVWVRIGNFDEAQRLLDAQVGALTESEHADALSSALVNQTYLAIRRNDGPTARAGLDAIQKLAVKGRFPDKLELDVDWQNGWLALQDGKLKSAESFFSKALKAAINDANKAAQVMALNGRALARSRQGLHLEARSDLLTAIEALAATPLSDEDKLRRELEIVSTFFHLGDYRSGWPLIRSVIERSDTVYGRYSLAQSAVHSYGLAWAIEIGDGSFVLNWIRDPENALVTPYDSLDGVQFSHWRVFEVSALLQLERYSEAENILERITDTSFLDSAMNRRAYALLLFEVALRQKRIGEALGLEKTYGEEFVDASKPMDESRAAWDWHRGWAHGVSGRIAESLSLLSRSLAFYVATYGDQHPSALKVRAAIQQVRALRVLSSGARPTQELKVLANVLSSLKQSYPENSPRYRLLESYESDALTVNSGMKSGDSHLPLLLTFIK